MDKAVTSNPKDLIGIKKPPVHLVPAALIINSAMAYSDGAKKYGPYNWRSYPVNLTVYIAAAQRHLLQLLDGEDCAQDSGHHHASHVAACMGIILDALATGNLIDDRPKHGAASQLIEELTSNSDDVLRHTLERNISNSVGPVPTSDDPPSLVVTDNVSYMMGPDNNSTYLDDTGTAIRSPSNSPVK